MSVTPHRDCCCGVVEYYTTPHGSWHGSDHPNYLSVYVHATGDRRAAAVLDYQVSQMPFWRRLWWRLTHRRSQ